MFPDLNASLDLISNSFLFDESWYLEEYPDVGKAGIDPILHFCIIGWKLNRSPSKKFDVEKYLDFYPDVKESGVNPLVHFIIYGDVEGRNCFSVEDFGDIQIDYSTQEKFDPITRLLISNCQGGKNSSEYLETYNYIQEHILNHESETILFDDYKEEVDSGLSYNLPNLPGSSNDYVWWKKSPLSKNSNGLDEIGLSVIIPTYNRTHLLSVTLVSLLHQETSNKFQVIVADDGSSEDILSIVKQYEDQLDISYVRQSDLGFRKSSVCNLAFNIAKYDGLAVLDCDMAPSPSWIEVCIEGLKESSDIALIGPRKYVDTSDLTIEYCLNDRNFLSSLNEITTNNDIASVRNDSISVDWRLAYFEKSQDLKLSNSPYRYFSGGNIAFHRKWLNITGGFDESFLDWGGEDVEFAYRLYRKGCFFRFDSRALAYHQEPPGLENETSRADGKRSTDLLKAEKVPPLRAALPLKNERIHERPLVTIYIPAFNAEKTIVKSINSALNQSFPDLEVCVCDDGSTDNTKFLIEKYFSDNPRVKFISKKNGGIGSASNSALSLSHGFYIGQLDADDYLEPDAVSLCLDEFKKDENLVCVYGAYKNVSLSGDLISRGYHCLNYSREKLVEKMIVHHFRMFTARSYHQIGGFDESRENAIDYDFFLRLSNVGKFVHLNKVIYSRALHETNTSLVNNELQEENKNFFRDRFLNS